MKLSIPRNIKPGKTWVVLGVALAIGLLAALIAYSYLSDKVAAIEARAKGQTVSVLVANDNLLKGARLTPDNVAIRAVPKEYAHSSALGEDEFERIAGQALAYPVNAGEMILWGLLEGKRAPTFSTRVENGRRAMTVPVDEINSISGMLEPGDVIDLMLTLEQNSRKVTFPLLQSVKVMATGQRSVDDPKSGERRSYSTVTLDTTPEQAQSMIVAREAGSITALLRNPQDSEPMANARLDITALLGDAPGDRQSIPVLYGGDKKMPADALVLDRYARKNAVMSESASTRAAPAAAGGAGRPSVSPPAEKAPVITSTAVDQ